MAAAIAIGLAVDDTMHFMLRYNQELKTSKSQSRAMQLTIYSEALPVICHVRGADGGISGIRAVGFRARRAVRDPQRAGDGDRAGGGFYRSRPWSCRR